MRTLGVIGGMSWESTAVYYRLLNQGVAQRLGGLHSAPLLLHSVDFAGIARAQAEGEWAAAGLQLAEAGAGLRRAGAEGLLLATNTMHKVHIAISAGAGLPLMHIADCTARALIAGGVKRAALLGTRFTMEDDTVVRGRLIDDHGLLIDVPPAEDRAEMHRIIFDELCKGIVDEGSRRTVASMIEDLKDRGAEAVILGCTEIGLLIGAADSALPIYDTTVLHCAAAVEWMFERPSAARSRDNMTSPQEGRP